MYALLDPPLKEFLQSLMTVCRLMWLQINEIEHFRIRTDVRKPPIYNYNNGVVNTMEKNRISKTVSTFFFFHLNAFQPNFIRTAKE